MNEKLYFNEAFKQNIGMVKRMWEIKNRKPKYGTSIKKRFPRKRHNEFLELGGSGQLSVVEEIPNRKVSKSHI